jgi:hypothetical protein
MTTWYSNDFAPVVSFTEAVGTTVISTDPIDIWGILVANDSSTIVEVRFRHADNSEEFMSVNVEDGDYKVIDIPFIADRGIEVNINLDRVGVSIFHSQAGR